MVETIDSSAFCRSLPRTCMCEQGVMLSGLVSLYILYSLYIMFVDQKYLNRTLAIDLPFQTFAVGLLVEFVD